MLQLPVQAQPAPHLSPVHGHHHWRVTSVDEQQQQFHDDPLLPPSHPRPFRSSSSSNSSPSTASPLSIATDFHPRPFPPRSPYLSAREVPTSSSSPRTYSPIMPPLSSPSPYRRPTTLDSRTSWTSSKIERVLAVGDVVGVGLELQGEILRARPSPVNRFVDQAPLAPEFEVVRRLGSGSYAVVYLVREVLARRDPSDDGHVAGRMELDDASSHRSSLVTYGREFAIKCLSKANLDEEALEAQMAEVSPFL
jgi:hypothetical protein